MGQYNGTPGGGQQGNQGPCMNDGDTASDGSRCGGRSAASRPGGVLN
ncbi:transmembrane anchored protein [Sinorhizobium medicae]|nr:transmembrane anchored protein [Sinorhizobium medicae]